MSDGVLIVGGGPAGVSAALDLRRQGIPVTMFEKGRNNSFKLPETLHPSAMHKLQKLQVVPKTNHSETFAIIGKDGKTRLTLTIDGLTNGVDRNELDSCLQDKAIDSGVRLIPEQVDDVTITLTGVEATSKGNVFFGRFLIDAAGKIPLLPEDTPTGHQTNLLDKRFSVFSHFENTSSHDFRELSIATVNDGFIYIIPITDTRVCVGLTLYNAVPIRDRSSVYQNAIEQCTVLNDILDHAVQILPVIPVINTETRHRPVVDGKIIRVGDALGFTDPFLWNGIGFALESGNLAASICAKSMDGEELQSSGYSVKIQELRDATRAASAKFYDEIVGQFNVKQLVDPHAPSSVISALLSLAGRSPVEYLASLRNSLNVNGGRDANI